jgi:hypothetical protein
MCLITSRTVDANEWQQLPTCGGSARHSTSFVCTCLLLLLLHLYTLHLSDWDVATGVSFNAPLGRASWGQPTGSGGGVETMIILRHACVVPLFRSTWWIFYIVTWAEDVVFHMIGGLLLTGSTVQNLVETRHEPTLHDNHHRTSYREFGWKPIPGERQSLQPYISPYNVVHAI